MKKLIFLPLLFLAFLTFSFVVPSKSLHHFKVKDIIGNKVSLNKYKGKVMLIVNVASKCGLTPQYADMQEVFDKYNDQGLVVMGFPANNFGNQEPGSEEDINRFCTSKYGVTFPMFSKVSVKGDDIHPLYQFLTTKKLNGKVEAPIKWNFQKFLINAKGKVVKSYHPQTKITSEKVIADIEREIKKIKKKK